jgi:hypothetical protein
MAKSNLTKLSFDALAAIALTRTPKGALTAEAKRARVEIDRRDANRAARRAARSGATTQVASSRVTEEQVVDLLAQARKVANRVAHQSATEVAPAEGEFVRTKLALRRDLLVALDKMGAQEFLATFAGA